MPKKNSNSTLPHELNENWGSNYMMDGFFHDMEYGHGLRENPPANPIPQPSTSGMAQLPDGMIMALEDELDVQCQDDEGAMDLGGMGIVATSDADVDRSDAGIVDHSWLSDAYQDPDRLPNSPRDNGIPELQETWGDRTDGIQRVDLHDRSEVRFEDANQEDEDDDPLHRDKLARILASAMRKSAAGEPLDRIKQHLTAQVNLREARAMAAPVKALVAEHGLVGNVYVRASAYPGLHRGRWSDSFKKAAKGCRYLIAVEGEDCASCASAAGLVLVRTPNDIDWNDAYAHYSPQLEMAGRLDRTATVMNKRLTLREAFLREGKAPRLHIETAKVHHTMPVDLVSSDEARRVLAERRTIRQTITDAPKQARLENENVAKKIGALVRARLLTLEEAKILCESKAPAQSRLRMAHLLATRTKNASYSGSVQGDARVRISAEGFAAAGRDAPRHEHTVRVASASEEAERRRLLEGFARLEGRYREARAKLDEVHRVVLKHEKKGKILRAWVDRLFDETERKMVAADLDPLLVRGGYYDDPNANSPRDYEGAIMREATAPKHEPVIPAKEISRLARWVRQQMSEGTAGNDLDQLLSYRAEPRILEAAGPRLARVRDEHEGLSGHLYVDVAAYASPEGTAGCDEGALRHRANGIKLALTMPRCEGCVFKNANGNCQKYNKKLVDEIDRGDGRVKAFRLRVIASHDQSDQEETASYFSGTDIRAALNPNPVDEFGLHNASLDDVDNEAPQYAGIDGIFFGGFEV
jgi:hypothetical protein